MKLNLPGLTFSTFLLLSISVSAQQRCYSYQHMKEQIAADPVFAQKMKESERNFSDYISQRGGGNIELRSGPLTIPVIVHVLYNSNSQKIPRSQVESQITVLNEDFTASNSDYNKDAAGYAGVKGDANISFCLEQVRFVKTKKKSFTTNDDMKRTSRGGDDPIDPTKYLNIWVCSIGQGILGYAQFPNGPAATDGVVINYRSFGKGAQYNLYADYDLGRTATHEVGHWLGLRHIWGDATCGNDFVDDTPLHDSPNYGCPGAGHRSICTGSPFEMWMNYMDYTDDACMYFFTDDQVSRMDGFLDTSPRLMSITQNSGCVGMSDVEVDNTGSTGGGGSGGGPPHGGGNPHGKLLPEDFIVYPTINSGTVNLKINAVEDGVGVVNVYSQIGALVYKQELNVVEGDNLKTIKLGLLSNGLYIVEYKQGDMKQSKKLVIQH